ncbi:MAG: type II toxin-antitoxin system prevent-host-death family antitoxin [Thermoleophilaceae bacterium]
MLRLRRRRRARDPRGPSRRVGRQDRLPARRHGGRRQRDLRNDVSAVLRRVRRGERLRITVAGRDAADLVPIDEAPTWMAGARAHELITDAQADAGVPTELADAFPDPTVQL